MNVILMQTQAHVSCPHERMGKKHLEDCKSCLSLVHTQHRHNNYFACVDITSNVTNHHVNPDKILFNGRAVQDEYHRNDRHMVKR